MREGPILMSGPLVVKTLADLKRQTRRLRGLERVNKDPGASWLVSCRDGLAVFGCRIPADDPCPIELKCPYGKAGDRLWVRETWAPCEAPIRAGQFQYAADGAVGRQVDLGDGLVWRRSGHTVTITPGGPDGVWIGPPSRWRPSIHMPRRASRLTLDIAQVRVERLQDISEEDARREGVEPASTGQRVYPGTGAALTQSYRAGFEKVWREINGDRPGARWEESPWVWVIQFRRVEEANHVR